LFYAQAVYLARLAVADFRSYAAADLRLEPGVSTMIGPNGQGKTNLVEAVAYLATLNSHRVATDAPLVRRGAQRAVLRAQVTSHDRDTLVEIEINPGRSNRARLNRVPVTRARQVLGVLRTVLFAPEDLALVKGDPDQRRRFLDDLLTASAPRYASVRSDYERVLRQRTALLKSLRHRSGPPGSGRRGDGGRRDDGADDGGQPAGSAPRMLEVWDEHLATLGAELLAGRIKLTAALRPLVSRSYSAVSGDSADAAVAYRLSLSTPALRRHAVAQRSGDAPADAGWVARGDEPAADRDVLAGMLRGALIKARAEELERGVCLVGPHRDDLELRIGNLPTRGYASQGEAWSMALSLRLAAYDLLRGAGDDPVLLLDDVFAELDDSRRNRLAELVAGAEQVIVTAAVAGDVPEALRGARFAVADGTVSRAG
jgi:DNA replication and repair protein RecF